MKRSIFLLPLLFVLFSWTSSPKFTADGADNGYIEVVFLQINDVYEISPVGGDKLGGLARVAQVRKELLAKNPNTFTVLAGDFISPSVIGTLTHDGKRIRGKQMVEVLNALGLDWTAFGNHEFDYNLPDLQDRLNESNFGWIGTNVKQVAGGVQYPFTKIKNGVQSTSPEHVILTAKDADGTEIKFGIFSACIASNPKPYVAYENHTAAARRSIEAMRPQTEFIVGLTHLFVGDDKQLLADFPEIPLIMGGHEHDNQMHKVGRGRVAKADGNAKTVYIHRVGYTRKTKSVFISSELRKIDASIPMEPVTAAAVTKWENIMKASLASSGFNPDAKVTTLTTPVDCRESLIRFNQAKIGEIICASMIAASKTAECAVLNSGSIRVDDILSGTITELDIVRVLPFGGGIAEVEMSGSLMRKMLDQGVANAGNGGYLQRGNITNPAPFSWLIKGAPLDDAKIYKIAVPEFLLTGNEQNMGFLKADPNPSGPETTNPDILSITKADPAVPSDLRADIRRAVIDYWRKL